MVHLSREGMLTMIRPFVFCTMIFLLGFCGCGTSRQFVPKYLEWGPEQHGLSTRLTVIGESPRVGNPILMRLEMHNSSDAPIEYDPQQVAVNDSLKVTGPAGDSVRYIAGPMQTSGGIRKIEPGETATLFDNFDLVSQYLIDAEGTYRIQFRGRRGGFTQMVFPPSNMVSVDVMPGALAPQDAVMARLLPLVPRDWLLVKSPGERVKPSGRGESEGFQVILMAPGRKVDIECVRIWLTSELVDSFVKDGSPLISVSELLGKTRWGYLYILMTENVAEHLPDAKARIAVALDAR